MCYFITNHQSSHTLSFVSSKYGGKLEWDVWERNKHAFPCPHYLVCKHNTIVTLNLGFVGAAGVVTVCVVRADESSAWLQHRCCGFVVSGHFHMVMVKRLFLCVNIFGMQCGSCRTRHILHIVWFLRMLMCIPCNWSAKWNVYTLIVFTFRGAVYSICSSKVCPHLAQARSEQSNWANQTHPKLYLSSAMLWSERMWQMLAIHNVKHWFCVKTH